MASGKHKLSATELELFGTDDSGALFWKEKKVRLGGLSAAAISAIIAALALFFAVITNYQSAKANAKVFWSDIKGATTSGTPAKH